MNGGRTMTFCARIVGIALIMVLVVTGGAFAVGYERYDDAAVSRVRPKTGMQTVSYQQDSASFFKKFPAALDEVAFFVRDILSQFGLANSKKP
jgi:hypothetical protein